MKHDTSKENVAAMVRLGVPYTAFLPKNKALDIAESAVEIKVDLPQTKTRTYSPARQVEQFEAIMSQPLRRPVLYVISSFPSDARAKQAALGLMQAAVKAHESKKSRGLNSRGRPLWINITGTYERDWLDKSKVNPSFMVVANIPETATPHKLEKARDLLEIYNDRPRILVTSAQDPLTFAFTKLQISPSGVLYLGPSDKAIGI